MSAPKFLTWSKGQSYSKAERKHHASSGIVPIPIECISFKGMDYGKGEKRLSQLKRRPIPLEFAKPEHSNSNSSSFALHDAAIKSATTLMSVMNDVLKSPHLSAHFHSQQSGRLQPPQGRPRSRTAPSTPMFEAPGVEPVELPGSIPVWPKSHHDVRCTIDTASSKHASMGRSIERPHSSPQPSSYAFQDDLRHPSLVNSRITANIRTMAGQAMPIGRCSLSSERQSSSSGAASLVPDIVAASTTKSAFPCVQSSISRAEETSTDGREYIDRHLCVLSTSRIFGEVPQPTDLKALLEQVSAMRRSHNAHVLSLKEEVESHKSYIAFLESCPVTTAGSQEPSKHGLTLDTSHITSKVSGPSSSDLSASTSLQSLDSTLEDTRRASTESATAEAEALRRKLSLCRKTQSELGDVRRERDQFRDKNDRSEHRIGQLKDLLRKSKDKDVAMKNKVQGLEAALLAANIQRIDVLEGYREACEQIQRLHDKQQVMVKDRHEALACGTPAESGRRVLTSQTTGETCGGSTQAKHAAITPQLEMLQRLVSEKDLRIGKLETERQDLVPKLDICRLEKQLSDAEAVRDQYNALLHTELRRRTKSIALSVHPAGTQVKDEAAAAVTEKLDSKPGSEITEKRCEFLEKELTHCYSEIILYKLDIRGYRKDLKEANAKIEGLQESGSQRPETPDSMGNTHDDKSASPGRRHQAASVLGLGIMQISSTPTRPSTTHLSTPQPPRAMASPASSANTPLELDKRLPKPPTESRYPSSNSALQPPTTDLSRTETVRSLSESIISSYAKRATPEQYHGHVPPLFRGYSSDLPKYIGARDDSYRAIDAIAVPISRYTPDMLKTPSMTTTRDLTVGKKDCLR